MIYGKYSPNKQQQLAKKQLIANGVSQITQSVYDGLILLHWATGKVLLVTNRAIEYRLVNPIYKEIMIQWLI